jgi:transposase
MVLTRQEKEKLILDLYNQGKTYKQIAETARVSPRDIKPVLEKAEKEREKELGINTQKGNNGNTENQNQTQKISIFSQAYHLFSEGKTPLEVAIELNLKESEVTKYYKEHWKLRQLHDLDLVYENIKGDIIYIVKLHRIMKAAGIGVEQAIHLIKIANNDLPALELKYSRLRKEIEFLELEKQKSRELGNLIKVLSKTSEGYNRQIKILHRKKVGLDSLVREFENNNEGYKKIRQIAEEEVNNTLSNSKDILQLAISSVVESIVKHPDRFNFLINSNVYNNGRQKASQPYIEVYRALILDEAEKIFKIMTRDLINKIIDNAISKLGPQPLVESSSRQNMQ